MSFTEQADLRYYHFSSFEPGFVQACFTRHGGTSPEPWDSLNMGATVGDEPQRVLENRRRAFSVLGRDPASLFDVWQVHGTAVAIAESPHPPGTPHQQADAILTDTPGLTLMMRFADCVPVILHDPVSRVCGIVHAGWLGTVRGTVTEAVKAMHSRFGCDPANILTGIGPSIGPDHYEVGLDVVNQVRQAFSGDAASLLIKRGDKYHLDLWSANRLLLEKVGVRHIEVAGVCTGCHVSDWYSHRLENGKTGRFGIMIALPT